MVNAIIDTDFDFAFTCGSFGGAKTSPDGHIIPIAKTQPFTPEMNPNAPIPSGGGRYQLKVWESGAAACMVEVQMRQHDRVHVGGLGGPQQSNFTSFSPDDAQIVGSSLGGLRVLDGNTGMLVYDHLGGGASGPDRPFHMCAWCKIRLGWLTARTVLPTDRQHIALRGVEGGPAVLLAEVDPPEHALGLRAVLALEAAPIDDGAERHDAVGVRRHAAGQAGGRRENG